jgi:hypothetical protein
MVCCRFLSVGLLALTALYVGLVVALEYLALPAVGADCLDGPCQSEGVDNTIVQWASDFFVALFLFLFALHLTCIGSNEDVGFVRKSGILAQIFMGGAFVLAGIGHWLYPNSGSDDNRGMVGYWIVWIGFAVFFTVSSLATAHFGMEAEADRVKAQDDDANRPWYRWCLRGNNDDQDDEDRTPHKCNRLVPLCQLLLVLSLTGFLFGGVWCSFLPDLQVDEVLDDAEPTGDVAACFQVMSISGVLLQLCYALMWVPVGLLLRAASRKSALVVLGLSTPVAAGTCILLQWSVGSMLVVYLELTNFIRKGDVGTSLELWDRVYGTVLYHWAMLLTFYCLHNVSCGLTIVPHKLMKKEKKQHEPKGGQQQQDGSGGGSWWDLDWLTATLCMGFAGGSAAAGQGAAADGAADDTDEESAGKKTRPLAEEVDTSSEGEAASVTTESKKTVKFAGDD